MIVISFKNLGKLLLLGKVRMWIGTSCEFYVSKSWKLCVFSWGTGKWIMAVHVLYNPVFNKQNFQIKNKQTTFIISYYPSFSASSISMALHFVSWRAYKKIIATNCKHLHNLTAYLPHLLYVLRFIFESHRVLKIVITKKEMLNKCTTKKIGGSSRVLHTNVA